MFGLTMAVFRGRLMLTSLLAQKPCNWFPRIIMSASSVASSPEVPLQYQQGSATVKPNFPVRPAFSVRLPPKFFSSEEEEVEIEEYFIPVTHSSIVRYLLEEPNFLNSNEKNKFENFAAALDHAVSLNFTNVHEDLKQLFAPVNPNAEPMHLRKMSIRDRLDNEFWLLQNLSIILEKANFFEVPHHVVDKITKPRVINSVKISIDRDKYAVLRLWAIGREVTHLPMPWYEYAARQLMSRYLPQVDFPSKPPQKFLKRVVAAVRLKSGSRLQIKAYRDVPASRLHLLFPNGQLAMSPVTKLMLMVSSGTAVSGAFVQFVTTMSGLDILWPLAAAFASSLIATGVLIRHKDKCFAHLAEMNRTQHFKTVAGSRSLLETLVFRARAECFKEALLTYAFLLAHRPSSANAKKSYQQTTKELGGLTKPLLEKRIEGWARRVFGTDLEFDAHESINYLQSLGLLKKEDESLRVVPLDVALNSLPKKLRTLSSEEGDLLEGYDKDMVLDDLLKEEERLKRYGWR